MTLLTLEWAWKANTGFRQCKHILVSLDELDVAVPQRDYVDQFETFVKHLFKAFDAEHTFPALIWLFTPSTNRCRWHRELPRSHSQVDKLFMQ